MLWVWICGFGGLAIFLFYLFWGKGASQEITMELGFALAFLAVTIGFDMGFAFQIATIVVVVILLLQKVFVKETKRQDKEPVKPTPPLATP